MADWQNHLELKDVFDKSGEGEMTPVEAAQIIGDRLAALELKGGAKMDHVAEKGFLVEAFHKFAKDYAEDGGEFDDLDRIIERLYNWADSPLSPGWNGKKLCWVNKF